MGISDAFDKLVKLKQAACEHFYQDRITTDDGIFCGACGVEITK